MLKDAKYHMRVDPTWLQRVKRFSMRHNIGGVAALIRLAVDKFMKEYKS